MRVSIALATYDGERFLEEQLASFLTQTRPPDELVVADDASNDGTMTILRRFAARAPFPVRILEGRENVGCTRNFERAIAACGGELIFLSDQDDVWLPQKIGTVEACFEAEAATLVVIHDAVLTDARLASTPFTRLGQIRSLGWSDAHFVNGSCTAFRRSFALLVCPVPDAESFHDLWLHLVATTLGARRLIEQPLQFYRRHGDNETGGLPSELRSLSRWDLVPSQVRTDPERGCRRRLERLRSVERRLGGVSESDLVALGLDGHRLAVVAREIEDERHALGRRLELLRKPRLARVPAAVRMLAARDYRHFNGWKSFLKDLSYVPPRGRGSAAD